MSPVNACLKWGFIVVTCLIGLASGLTLGLTLFGHGYFHGTDDLEDMMLAIKVLYGIATATFLLAVIGVYGASKGKPWLLIIFSVGMSLTIVFVAFDFVALTILRKQAGELTLIEHRDCWLTPLDTANATDLPMLHEFQHLLQCCGVEKGYEDWGSHIHKSCICEIDEIDCIPAPANSSLYEDHDSSLMIMIYQRPCLPILVHYVNLVIDVMITILATVVLFWSTCLVLAILIVVQLKRKVEVPPVYYSAEAKAGNYASLAENGDIE
ncbi:hypothetical protein NHX12_020858 [Muraenolepis orangiensis]|uniref:Tetraspanin n=1 Tax=Muraenolepis orangiensis TaxID=630683 RepID=A0A9Q0EXU1_9TELE|nr:hypothetical protein NHX12_020858 [Muraenolepis orangiensis]